MARSQRLPVVALAFALTLVTASPLAGDDSDVNPSRPVEARYVGASIPVAAVLVDAVPTLTSGALSLLSYLWGGPVAVEIELVEQVAVARRVALAGKTRFWIGDGLHGVWQQVGLQVRPFGGHLSGCFAGLYLGLAKGASYYSGPFSFWSTSADLGYQYVFSKGATVSLSHGFGLTKEEESAARWVRWAALAFGFALTRSVAVPRAEVQSESSPTAAVATEPDRPLPPAIEDPLELSILHAEIDEPVFSWTWAALAAGVPYALYGLSRYIPSDATFLSGAMTVLVAGSGPAVVLASLFSATDEVPSFRLEAARAQFRDDQEARNTYAEAYLSTAAKRSRQANTRGALVGTAAIAVALMFLGFAMN